MAEKIRKSTAECFAHLKTIGLLRDGMSVMVGGFGLCGIPEQLIIALRDTGTKNLTCISNNAGVDDWGLGLLLQTRQIKKMISSYVGENDTFEAQFLGGQLEVEFNPQGTLAERIRAGGAGIPAFYTATGAGTIVADGKETRTFHRPSDIPTLLRERASSDGPPRTPRQFADAHPDRAQRDYVLETGLFADLALVKAHKADPFGNLVYHETARNFNPVMATAAQFVIAEVDELVPLGSLPPDSIHTPGNYVDLVVRTVSEKRIEQRTTRPA